MQQIRTSGILLFLLMVLTTGCSRLKEASDLLSNPTAKERYQKEHNISDELFKLWERQVQVALQDSLQIDLPYLEKGAFSPRSFFVYSYEISLNAGEVLDLQVQTDSLKELVFIEFYEKKDDSLPIYEKLESSKFGQKDFHFESEKAGEYKLVIQPEIEANTPFSIKIGKNPAYLFPVTAAGNRNVQSYWGADRDGGARRHEGVDIFAKRGTPVVAATNGRIGYTGEKGLGGKQVWLRDTQRNQSLYYAHLDSIAKVSGRVQRGDTLGFVGNSGNARTTPPHLHFGIYRGYGGAINPLHYVYKTEEIKNEETGEKPASGKVFIKSSKANLRNKPSTRNSIVLETSLAQDTLQVLGKTGEWLHIRTAGNKASFIHQSLVAPL